MGQGGGVAPSRSRSTALRQGRFNRALNEAKQGGGARGRLERERRAAGSRERASEGEDSGRGGPRGDTFTGLCVLSGSLPFTKRLQEALPAVPESQHPSVPPSPTVPLPVVCQACSRPTWLRAYQPEEARSVQMRVLMLGSARLPVAQSSTTTEWVRKRKLESSRLRKRDRDLDSLASWRKSAAMTNNACLVVGKAVASCALRRSRPHLSRIQATMERSKEDCLGQNPIST